MRFLILLIVLSVMILIPIPLAEAGTVLFTKISSSYPLDITKPITVECVPFDTPMLEGSIVKIDIRPDHNQGWRFPIIQSSYENPFTFTLQEGIENVVDIMRAECWEEFSNGTSIIRSSQMLDLPNDVNTNYMSYMGKDTKTFVSAKIEYDTPLKSESEFAGTCKLNKNLPAPSNVVGVLSYGDQIIQKQNYYLPNETKDKVISHVNFQIPTNDFFPSNVDTVELFFECFVTDKLTKSVYSQRDDFKKLIVALSEIKEKPLLDIPIQPYDNAVQSFDRDTKILTIDYDYGEYLDSMGAVCTYRLFNAESLKFANINGSTPAPYYNTLDLDSCKGTLNLELGKWIILDLNDDEKIADYHSDFTVKLQGFNTQTIDIGLFIYQENKIDMTIQEYVLSLVDIYLRNFNLMSEPDLDKVINFPSYVEKELPQTEQKKKKGNGGCSDCTPPTLNFNSEGEPMVDNGITINNFSTNADYFHTELIQNTTLGTINHVELKYYENQGVNNIQVVQLGSVKEIGTPLSESEFLIEVHMAYFSNDIENPLIKEIVLHNKSNIISLHNVTTSLTPCLDTKTSLSNQCLVTSFDYSYNKVPSSFVLVAESFDYSHNTQKNYFNHGLTVIDTSPPIQETISIKEEKQCTDPIQKVMNRNNCNFRLLSELWK